MNVYWTVLIVGIVVRSVTGKDLDDVRERGRKVGKSGKKMESDKASGDETGEASWSDDALPLPEYENSKTK